MHGAKSLLVKICTCISVQNAHRIIIKVPVHIHVPHLSACGTAMLHDDQQTLCCDRRTDADRFLGRPLKNLVNH